MSDDFTYSVLMESAAQAVDWQMVWRRISFAQLQMIQPQLTFNDRFLYVGHQATSRNAGERDPPHSL